MGGSWGHLRDKSHAICLDDQPPLEWTATSDLLAESSFRHSFRDQHPSSSKSILAPQRDLVQHSSLGTKTLLPALCSPSMAPA